MRFPHGGVRPQSRFARESHQSWTPELTLSRLPLTLAISEYDHVADLVNGRVVPEGIDLRWLDLQIEETHFRAMAFREFDASELSFGKYASLVSQGDQSLSAIPVFPLRMARHSSIYIRRDGPVQKPEDFAGAPRRHPRVGADSFGVHARLAGASVWPRFGRDRMVPGRRRISRAAPRK